MKRLYHNNIKIIAVTLLGHKCKILMKRRKGSKSLAVAVLGTKFVLWIASKLKSYEVIEIGCGLKTG